MPIPETVTTAELASLVGITREQLHRYKDQGIISPSDRNEWRTVETVCAMMAHYRSGVSRGGTNLDLAAERAKLAKEQTETQAMKNAAMRRELLPASAVNSAMQSAFARCRARLLSIPSKLAPVLLTRGTATEMQDSLFDAVSDALAELAATVVCPVESDSGSGEDVVADPVPAAEDDRKPVVRRKQGSKPGSKRGTGAVGHEPRGVPARNNERGKRPVN